MRQPPGFVDPIRPTHICQLRWSLYGLKQAPRAWFLQLSEFLLKLGFIGSAADTSLFILRTSSYVMFMLIYVDDIILTSTPNAPFTCLFNKVESFL